MSKKLERMTDKAIAGSITRKPRSRFWKSKWAPVMVIAGLLAFLFLRMLIMNYSYEMSVFGMRMGWVELPEPDYYCDKLDLEVVNDTPVVVFSSGWSSDLYFCEIPLNSDEELVITPHIVGKSYDYGNFLSVAQVTDKFAIASSGWESLFFSSTEHPQDTVDWGFASLDIAETSDSKEFAWVDDKPVFIFEDSLHNYRPPGSPHSLGMGNDVLVFARCAVLVPSKPGDWLSMIVLPFGNTSQYWKMYALSNVNSRPVVCATTQNGLEYGFPKSATPVFSNDWNVHTMVSGTSTQYIEIFDYQGKPVVCWVDSPSSELRLAICQVAFPTHALDWQIHTIDQGQEIRDPSICTVGGKLAVAYQVEITNSYRSVSGRGYYYDYGEGEHELRFAQAVNNAPSSKSDWVFHTVDGPGGTGYFPEICGYNSQPLIAYFDARDSSVKLAQGIAREGSSAIFFEQHTILNFEDIESPEDNAYHRYLMGIDDDL